MLLAESYWGLTFCKEPMCAPSLVMSDSFATPWTIAHQAPLSMGFLRQGYWSRFPFPISGDLPDPGIELVSPGFLALAGEFFTSELPGKPRR